MRYWFKEFLVRSVTLYATALGIYRTAEYIIGWWKGQVVTDVTRNNERAVVTSAEADAWVSGYKHGVMSTLEKLP